MKPQLAFLLATLLIISACAQKQAEVSVSQPSVQTPPKTEAQPENKPVQEVVTPKVEPAPKEEVSSEVSALIAKSKTRVPSVFYKYQGPETASNYYEFYVKGDKMKYLPSLAIKSLDSPESVDTIFIDKAAKTAASYCLSAICKFKGKKADLNYQSAYVDTMFDWIQITSGTKVGEEVIDSRSTWKIQTNKGTVWLDTFYGIPLKAESAGGIYKFQQLSVGSVQDSDVTPPK
jgi:hypothetical protein